MENKKIFPHLPPIFPTTPKPKFKAVRIRTLTALYLFRYYSAKKYPRFAAPPAVAHQAVC